MCSLLFGQDTFSAGHKLESKRAYEKEEEY